MNKGEFRGSGLDKMTGKEHDGTPIPLWYREKRFADIEKYIIDEARAFGEIYEWLHKEMPELHQKFLNFMNKEKI